LLPPDSKAIADRSDVIFEAPKCSKIKIFRGSAPLGELTALPRPLADGERSLPLPRTSPPLAALRASRDKNGKCRM